jgi:hypothetical protein
MGRDTPRIAARRHAYNALHMSRLTFHLAFDTALRPTFRFIACAASALACAAAPCAAVAQARQPQVHWEIEVIRDGQPVDRFEATTTVGQAKSDTHRRTVTHNVGCQDVPAATIELSRAITVSPIREEPNGAVVLSIDSQETLEESAALTTSAGCAMPPQPRRVSAAHPGLPVPAGQSVDWTIVDKNPLLIYRVRANVVASQ